MLEQIIAQPVRRFLLASGLATARKPARLSKDVSDLRRYRRYAVGGESLRVAWLDLTGNMKVSHGRALSVSVTGLALELPAEAMTRSMIRFRSETEAVTGAGDIRYCHLVGGKYIVGLEFTNGLRWQPPEEDILEPIRLTALGDKNFLSPTDDSWPQIGPSDLVTPQSGRNKNGNIRSGSWFHNKVAHQVKYQEKTTEDNQFSAIQRLLDATTKDPERLKIPSNVLLPPQQASAISAVATPDPEEMDSTAIANYDETVCLVSDAMPTHDEMNSVVCDSSERRFAVLEDGYRGDLKIVELSVADDPVECARDCNAFLIAITITRDRAEFILDRARASCRVSP